MNNQKLFTGTSGILLPYKNQSAYPPALQGQSRLAVYSTLLNSLEVNALFYKLPKPSTIEHWCASVNDGFRFTFKLWKQITHSRLLDYNTADLEWYFEVIAPAQDKAGCILVQFPASVSVGYFKKVENLLAALQQLGNNRWPLALEFRNSSWYDVETYDLLNYYKATMVIHDKSGSESPQPELHSDQVYLRFHGPNGDYKESYDETFLNEYAGYVNEWLLAGKTVYAYFNNTMGAALNNLDTLKKNISRIENGPISWS